MTTAAKALAHMSARHHAHVSLFCPCGWAIELFNGELGKCSNKQCSEYDKLYEISVTVIAVNSPPGSQPC